jgi:hypothetical protein
MQRNRDWGTTVLTERMGNTVMRERLGNTIRRERLVEKYDERDWGNTVL